MTDLAAKIHERMEVVLDTDPLKMRDAVDNVLFIHTSDRGNGPDPDNRCFECAEVMPCPTLRAVAGGLGVLEDPEG